MACRQAAPSPMEASVSVTVLVPTADPGVPITPYKLGIRPSRFEGVMGFIANSQPGSVDFLQSLAPHVLSRLTPAARTHFEDKGQTPARSGVLMTANEADETARTCDAAILAYGHCGGCTSSTIRDAVALARRGVPVVALVVPFFAAEARFITRATGMPDLPVYVLPGPMVRRTSEERAAVAAEVADDIVRMLEPR